MCEIAEIVAIGFVGLLVVATICMVIWVITIAYNESLREGLVVTAVFAVLCVGFVAIAYHIHCEDIKEKEIKQIECCTE